ncbi:MAG: dicarboxylate/amino acid:cation symporter [Chitinophagales bacterium]|nr:dicarboxylate/amino acid:cation symporter [Bacteroidota bacterium]
MALHWKILIGMFLGVVLGIAAAYLGWSSFVINWIKPFGTIFINLLKLIAIPLILVSLIKGVSDLSDITRLSRIGYKTIALYLFTTFVAVVIGLVLVNIIRPGTYFSEEKRAAFQEQYAGAVAQKNEAAHGVAEESPLQFLVDIVPDNVFSAFANNGKMLQVIFFAIFFGLCLLLIEPTRAQPVKDFIEGVNEVVMKMIDIIMQFAPIGVFALLGGLVADFAGENPQDALALFGVLGLYALVVVVGLAIMLVVVYPSLLRIFVKYPLKKYINGLFPAQLVAFSTSSSAATLPVTMERVQDHLGVSKEVASFVLPIGATVNMDGTSLYQAVAAVFIAQAMGMDLSLATQLGIVATTMLASIGAAAVPGAGMIMLVIVMEQAGIPLEGLALIFAVDRPLDMLRTAVNVTSDATVSMIVANSEKELHWE